MPSGVFDSILLRDSWSTAELRAVFSDESRVQKWYEVEATLASEQAAFGIVPREAAGDIMRNAKVEKVDLAEIARAMGEAKHPLVPALRALQKLCKPELGEWLHYGPTTQDILDTGMALQLKEAHAIILRDLRAVGRALYALAEHHRATPMPGRTHGVQALPITFGHKCAIWLRERDLQRQGHAIRALGACRRTRHIRLGLLPADRAVFSRRNRRATVRAGGPSRHSRQLPRFQALSADSLTTTLSD